MKNQGLLITFICSVFLAFSQEEIYDLDENIYDDIIPKHSVTIELGLPNTSSNKPFKSIMQGLLKFNPYYQFTLKNHLAFGVGATYSYFKVNPFRVPEKVTGGLHSTGAFVKVGYEKFHSMRFGTDIGVKFGYVNNQFTTDMNTKNHGGPFVSNAFYVEPTLGLILTASEFTSYRFVAGYSILGNKFRTSDLGISSTGGYTESEINKNSQYMYFGFGFTYYFKQYQ
jgi:hypothetical protein